MSASPAYQAWMRRLDRGYFLSSEARQWAKALEPIRQGWPPSGARTNLTAAEADLLHRVLIHRGGVLIGTEDTARAKRWLNTGGAKRIGIVPATAALVDRFTFHGDIDGSPRGTLVPVYRAHLDDETAFDYWAYSWQAKLYGHEMDTREGHEWITQPTKQEATR